jgi:ABC-2 type transport system permease protein
VSEPSAVTTQPASPPLRAPALSEIFRALLEADFTVQLRNNRALLLSFALPLVVLYALFASFAVKRGIIVGDPQFKVAAALTLGMASIAILGYSMTVARDREKGVFQRLRVTPAPTWAIMTSRLLVQVAANLAMALVLLVAANLFVGVSLTAEAYLLTFICVIFSSALFLSVGQALAGLVKSADTLNAVGRIAYLPLFALGLFGQSTVFGTTFELISRWSPGGTVETLLSGAMNPSSWNSDTWLSLAVSTAYSVVFAGIGIRWFQWGAR